MKFAILGVLFLSILHTHEDPSLIKDSQIKVNSGEAVYDGKKIVLIGDVVVQHSLGRISAHRLSLLPQQGRKKNSKFSSLEISDKVLIELKEGGQLQCEKGEVDYEKMQGSFLGTAEFPDVVFLNQGEGNGAVGSKRAPIEVKSNQMTFKLSFGADTASSETHVSQIEAIQNVRVGYNQDYQLLADHALYQRLPHEDNSSHQGLLTLTVMEGRPFCRLTNLNEDILDAKTIQVNTFEHQMQLDQPEGKLLMRKEGQPVQALEFKANELTWDDRKQTLRLKGAVDISQNGSLHVQTDHEMTIVQTNFKDKRTLSLIQSPVNTQISYTDVKGITHRILAPGALTIDHEKQEMTLQGAADRTGQPDEKRQVYIEDLMGDMYADSVRICYHWEGSRIEPEKIILEGNVKLLNRFDGHVDESGSILHYALADIVEFSPKQNEMSLGCSDGNRVLFFDKVNNIQMSAPSLKVRQDTASGKEMIQGEGDVRFTFIEKEIAQLKQRFKLGDSSTEGGEHAK